MILRETKGIFICFLAFLALTSLTIAEGSAFTEDTVVIAVDSDDAKKNVFNGFPPTGIYEKLVTRNREGGYDGWLAESWESIDWIAKGTMLGRLQATLKTVKEIPEFEASRKLIDLGGGHGLFGIGFAQENPDLEVVIFDQPGERGVKGALGRGPV